MYEVFERKSSSSGLENEIMALGCAALTTRHPSIRKSWHIVRQLAQRWQYGCQPYAPAALYSPETFMFLVLISVRG
jgi:hypothetical protein